MAQTYNFKEAGVELVIPGSYVNTTVINGNAATATTGVIALIGEANSGPSYDNLEKVNVGGVFILRDKTTKERVAFTPDELTVVKGLFGGGNLVDAFNSCSQPFAPNVVNGAPSLIYCIRTNKTNAVAASADLVDGTPAKLGTFTAKATGLIGNSISVSASKGTANGTTALIPIDLTISYGTNVEKRSVNTKCAMKLTAIDIDSHVTINSTEIIVDVNESNKTYKFANLTVSQLVEAINKDTSTTNVTAAVVDGEYRYVSAVGLFDYMTNVTLTQNSAKYLTMCGYQLKNELASSLVSVVPTYTVPALANAPKFCDANTTTVDTKSLGGGVLGATSNTDVEEALAVLKNVNVNFVVPLFSQDATTDSAEGATSSSSTYEVNKVVQYAVKHVEQMSAIKIKKNRQAFVSRVGYANAVALVQSGTYMDNTPYQYRASVAFQKAIGVDASGNSKTFQPWMVSAIAAGAQAVAGYRPIFNKALNIDGIVDPSEFGATVPEYETALKSGLLVLAPSSDGFSSIFLSDQTAYYYPDNNFVYNSVQAVYGADIIAQTIQQQMQVFVGQSNADVNATVALVYLQSVMSNLLLNKWIAASSDAPAGFKNASVTINGPTMKVSLEAKEATGIYFVPINLSISAVQSAA
jgi:hypothetical protein